MALETANRNDIRSPNNHVETDDPVIADWRALQESMERTPIELLIKSINSIARNQQAGRLTAEEANTLIKQLAAAAVGAQVNATLLQYVMPSTRERWRAFRHFRQSFLAHEGSRSTP
jgi:hypothetical protein